MPPPPPRSLSQAAGTSFLFHLCPPPQVSRHPLFFIGAGGSQFCFLRLKAHFCLRKPCGRFSKCSIFFMTCQELLAGCVKQPGRCWGGPWEHRSWGRGPCPLLMRGNKGWGWLREGRQGRQGLSQHCLCLRLYWVYACPERSLRSRGQEAFPPWCSFQLRDNLALLVGASCWG